MKSLLSMFLVAVMLCPITVQASSSPKAVVQVTVDGVIEVLKSRKDPDHLSMEDRQAIRSAVKGHFDFREMAKRSMGRGWREINDGQKQHFVLLFQELLERSYGNRLAQFNNQTVEYGKVRVKGRRARVNTQIVDPDKAIPVRYSLYSKDNEWHVYDIRIEGLSLIATFRTDFKTIYRKEGYEGLVQKLETKVANLKKEDQ